MIIVGLTAAEIRAIAARARLPISDAQVHAIADQAAVYESDASPAAGLHHITLARDTATAAGAIAASFHYLHLGLPRDLGLEVTVFGVDGDAIYSLDFG